MIVDTSTGNTQKLLREEGIGKTPECVSTRRLTSRPRKEQYIPRAVVMLRSFGCHFIKMHFVLASFCKLKRTTGPKRGQLHVSIMRKRL